MKDSIRFFTIWGAKWKEFKNRFYLSLLAGMSPSTASEKKRKRKRRASIVCIRNALNRRAHFYLLPSNVNTVFA